MPASRWTALTLLGLGYSIALYHGRLEAPALGALLVLALAALAVQPARPVALRRAGHGVFIVTGLTLALHGWPGFDNAPLMALNTTSPQTVPFITYWNLDKPLIGLWIVVACPWLWQRVERAQALRISLGIAVAVTGLCLALACALKVTGWAPKWPSYSLWWLLNNLLLVSLTEELLFRGYLQGAVQHWLQPYTRRWPVVAALPVVLVAMLFGLAHAGGGGSWVLLATLAGIGYGIAWRYGGLWAAVSTHFCLNMVHFIFFAYPMLAR